MVSKEHYPVVYVGLNPASGTRANKVCHGSSKEHYPAVYVGLNPDLGTRANKVCHDSIFRPAGAPKNRCHGNPFIGSFLLAIFRLF